MKIPAMFSTHFLPKVIDEKELKRIITTFLKREWPDKDRVHDIKFDGSKGKFYVLNDEFELDVDGHKIDFTIYTHSSADPSTLGEKFRATMNILFEKYAS